MPASDSQVAVGQARQDSGNSTTYQMIQEIRQLAHRLDRLEEILDVFRDYGSPDRQGFDALQRRLLDHGIEGGYLWREYQRSFEEKATPPCDTGVCRICGVCND